MLEIGDIKITKSVAALLDAARQLFWKHGIRRITVEEICEVADVSKMTFYRTFTNKYELAHLIIKDKLDKNTAVYDEIMCSPILYTEKIKAILELKRSESKEMSIDLVRDIYSQDPDYKDLKEVLDTYRHEFLLKLKQDFTTAQAQGNIRPDLPVDFIIFMLGKFQLMLEDEQLFSLFGNAEELSMALTNTFFYGILKHDEES